MSPSYPVKFHQSSIIAVICYGEHSERKWVYCCIYKPFCFTYTHKYNNDQIVKMLTTHLKVPDSPAFNNNLRHTNGTHSIMGDYRWMVFSFTYCAASCLFNPTLSYLSLPFSFLLSFADQRTFPFNCCHHDVIVSAKTKRRPKTRLELAVFQAHTPYGDHIVSIYVWFSKRGTSSPRLELTNRCLRRATLYHWATWAFLRDINTESG